VIFTNNINPLGIIIYFADGDDLSSYGINATVLHLPGHSKGSIGILTTNGVLFCGDLFMNLKRPDRSSLIDRKEDLDASIESFRG
jgi:glyoxylase-like metal-dependent hydrolase (beta-lactamase superfamily II)